MKLLNSRIEIKSIKENGEISGYASAFNIKDGYNDVTLRGAFAKAVDNFKSGKYPKLLWQHDASVPIGVIKEMYEDDYGLFIRCQLLLKIEKAREIYALLKMKAIDGFSIGYRIKDSYFCNGVRYLTDIDLIEISIVTFPACEEATVAEVKTDAQNAPAYMSLTKNHFEQNEKNNERKKIMMDKQSTVSNFDGNINAIAKSNRNSNVEQIKTVNETTLPLEKIDNNNGTRYQKADFSNYIRNGIDDFFQKSLDSSSGKNGGYFLPTFLVEQIHDRMKFLSPMRSIAKVMTVSSNSIDMLVDSKNPDAGWTGDNKENKETETPEIQKIKIPVHEIYAKPKASQRLLDDTQVNVEEWLITKISEKIAMLENSAFVSGNGTDKPKGFLNYETVDSAEKIEIGKLQHFKTGTDGKFPDDTSTVNLLIDIVCSVRPIYARNAKWIMPRSALSCIRKLKNKDGVALWQPSIAEATPSMLLGYPVILDDDMPALKEGTKSSSIAFGDFSSGYQIVDRSGLKIIRDPYTSKPFVEFYVSKRTGGAVIDFEAIKVLKFEK